MSNTVPTDPNDAQPRIKFTVRSLIIAVALIGVVFGWAGNNLRYQRGEHRLAAICEHLGASITYTGDEDGQVTALHFANSTLLNNDHLQELSKLSRLQTLWLNQSKVTGQGLAALERFPALRELHVHRDQLTDDGLRYLKRLSDIETLTIWGLQFDDPRLSELQVALPNCKVSS